MNFPIFSISKDCIGCGACSLVSKKHFGMNKNERAFIKIQPSTEEEFQICIEAIKVCPVDQIFYEYEDLKPILPDSKIKETIDKYPELVDILIGISNKFKVIQNPIMYNTLIRFTTFNDFAKYSHHSICEILISVNKHLGLREKLFELSPECADELDDSEIKGEYKTWKDSDDILMYSDEKLEEITSKIIKLNSKKSITVVAYEKPTILLKTVIGLGFKFNIENNGIYRISIYNPKKK